MLQVNLNYKVKATVVSPLSIGQGGEKDWVEGIDYIRKDNMMYHLDLQRMTDAGIPINILSALFASGDIRGIRNLISGKLDDIYDLCMEMPVGSANPIKTFYFNPITWKYILFGSSLKGAIRSSLFHSLTYGENRDSLKEKKGLDDFVFGQMKDGTDFMRFIRIRDFSFDETELVNTKIYNLFSDGFGWKGGWKHGTNNTSSTFNDKGFNTVYECLMPGSVSKGAILFSPVLYEAVIAPMELKDKKDAMMSESPIYHLFEAINETSLNYIIKEIAFFKEYNQGEHSDIIVSALEKYYAIAKTAYDTGNKSCLIKMSAGSGFHSITGDWQYDDYTDTGYLKNGKKRYKSRKIACYDGKFSPMGFLKLEVID